MSTEVRQPRADSPTAAAATASAATATAVTAASAADATTTAAATRATPTSAAATVAATINSAAATSAAASATAPEARGQGDASLSHGAERALAGADGSTKRRKPEEAGEGDKKGGKGKGAMIPRKVSRYRGVWFFCTVCTVRVYWLLLLVLTALDGAVCHLANYKSPRSS